TKNLFFEQGIAAEFEEIQNNIQNEQLDLSKYSIHSIADILMSSMKNLEPMIVHEKQKAIQNETEIAEHIGTLSSTHQLL
ncbi:hypothetical protein WAJ64_23315, partial [Acinetobacter baumannii]